MFSEKNYIRSDCRKYANNLEIGSMFGAGLYFIQISVLPYKKKKYKKKWECVVQVTLLVFM